MSAGFPTVFLVLDLTIGRQIIRVLNVMNEWPLYARN